MALILLQPGTQPLGQFDGYDSQVTSFKGGEVCTWLGVDASGSDKAAADSFDGYGGTSTHLRPVVTLTLTSSSKPLFLADDGTTGYGTLFGTVVGGTVGQTSYGPLSSVPSAAVLGPHTATGSGKITLWDKPGLYGVTLDAVDTASGGILVSNASCVPGVALTYTTAGLLTVDGSGQDAGGALVGRFAEFASNGSLVTTPRSLTRVGTGGGMKAFTMAVFWYAGAAGGA